jgi:hypothetical protein
MARGVKAMAAPMELFCVPLADRDPDRVAYILAVVSFDADRQRDEAEFETPTKDMVQQDFG